MKKYTNHIVIFLLVSVSWAVTLLFWFNNVDLSYMKTYIDLSNPIGNFNLALIMRGHVLLQLLSFIVFKFNPIGYYLLANTLHAILTVMVYLYLNKLFANKKLNLLLSLLFGINISYANVLFEGSFNQYYPLLLILILLSVFPFVDLVKNKISKYKEANRFIIPALLMAIGFVFRETILLIPIILFMVMLISAKSRRQFIYSFKYLLLPFLVSIGYLFIRFKLLGELKSDLTDDAVQMRNTLIQSGNYFELVKLIFINFLRMSSEQVLFFARWINSGLFVTVSSGLLSVMAIFYMFKKVVSSKKGVLINIAKFGVAWFVSVNIFISFVLPFPIHTIGNNVYMGNTLSRYNYWGFLGAILVLGSFLSTIKLTKKLYLLLIAAIIVNFALIQYSGIALYKNKHLPAKNFYQVVLSKYKSFPSNTVIYYNFFAVNNLRDYIGDLTYVFKDVYYPSTKFILETSFSHVQNEYLNNRLSLESVFSFDLDQKGMLVDKTDIARKRLKELSLAPIKIGPNLEVPGNVNANAKYYLDFWMMADKKKNLPLCDINSREIENYLYMRDKYLSSVKVSTSSTYGDYPRFYFINSNNLIDNQFGQTSRWQSNIGDNEQSIVLDLVTPKTINGLTWYSYGDYAYPTFYTIYASTDGKDWKEIKSFRNIDSKQRLDRFDKDISTRYVKFKVHSTKSGQPVMITEIEAMDYSNYYLENYEIITKLIDPQTAKSCVLSSAMQPGRVMWKTDKNSVSFWDLNITTDGEWRKYRVPVSTLEIYSSSKQILDENLKTLEILSPNSNLEYKIKDVMLIPVRE